MVSSKLPSTCPEENFKATEFFRKKILIFLDFREQVFVFCWKKFKVVVITTFYVYLGTFWAKGIKLWIESFENFLAGFVNTAFCVCIRTFWSKQVFPQKNFLISLDVFWTDFVFLLKKVAGIIKTAFYVSIGTFLRESIFLNKFIFE